MSFSFSEQRLNVWGILNVTPDSFSDGGQNLNSPSCQQTIQSWRGVVDGIDVGAESTAPMNRSITFEEECRRLAASVVPLLPSWPKGVTLSLDSYRPETAQWFFSQVPTDIPCVWNDVSGVVDEQTREVLTQFPKLRYVLCFNPSPTRLQSGDHKNHIQTGNITELAREFFRPRFDFLMRHELFSRTIADPAFGFAKSREQNHQLMRDLPQLMEGLACPQWVWGVSRKSFLRFPESQSAKDPMEQVKLDGLQLIWMKEALDKLVNPHTIVLRVHNPALMGALSSWSELQKHRQS
jgi:dihydropteroate synthase